MFRRRRAMTSEQASIKKRSGHIREQIFAELINGDVISGRGKADVIDPQENRYSIKGAEWWQIFMYGRNRFVTNTEFLEIGNIAELIIECLDAFPETKEEYDVDVNKTAAKRMLQLAMRRLKVELCLPGMFSEFLSKGMFDGDRVDYFAVLEHRLSGEHIPRNQKHFHVFSASEVVDVLSTQLVVDNSTAQGVEQMDALKVIFLYKGRNTGELEIRVDTSHYRKARWRFNSDLIIGILRRYIGESRLVNNQISVYGRATHDLLEESQ